ncbi:MAG: glycosyltransferase family 9 protein [Phycisphaerales bacterium]|nr:glycosyltransferase family 9 protein [Phycisphaerales bacterium]
MLIRPSALGDVVRTVPVLVSLRQRYGDARIDWIVQDAFVEGVAAHPDLSEAVPFARRKYGGAFGWISALGWMARLRKRRYDVVYDCQGLLRSAIFTWATRAPRRIGFANAREGGARLYTERIDVDPDLHTVDRMLELIEQAGVEPVRDMRLYVPVKAQQSWDQKRERLGIADEHYAVVAPTSRWPGKNWPADRFAETIDWMLQHGLPHVLIVGAKSERTQCQSILDQAEQSSGRIVDLMGKTSVGELMALIAGSSCVLANDSAALHIAVGFDRPIVALFGATDPRRVGPYGRLDDVVRASTGCCSISHKDEYAARRLMEEIHVKTVIERIERIIDWS